MQNLGPVAPPHGSKGRSLGDCGHVGDPRGKIILGQLAVLMAEPSNFEQAELHQVIEVPARFLPLGQCEADRRQRGMLLVFFPMWIILVPVSAC